GVGDVPSVTAGLTGSVVPGGTGSRGGRRAGSLGVSGSVPGAMPLVDGRQVLSAGCTGGGPNWLVPVFGPDGIGGPGWGEGGGPGGRGTGAGAGLTGGGNGADVWGGGLQQPPGRKQGCRHQLWHPALLMRLIAVTTTPLAICLFMARPPPMSDPLGIVNQLARAKLD